MAVLEEERAPELSKRERELRRRFVDEYLFDYQPISAAIRMGYQESYAETYAKQFLREPYTLKLIKERELELGISRKEDSHREKVIQGLYKEATSPFNSGAARVAAYMGVAKIVGLEAPVKSEVKVSQSPDMSHLTLEEKLAIKKKLFPDAP